MASYNNRMAFTGAAATPRSGSPLSMREIGRMAGGMRGPLANYLRFLASRDVLFLNEEFTEFTSTRWTVANSGGTGVSNFAIPSTPTDGGSAQGATGTSSGGSQSLLGPLIYNTDFSPGMEIRLKVSAITSYKIEVGFIDAVPGSNNGAVNSSDTPTFNATNFVGIGLDTSASTNNTLTGFAVGNGSNQSTGAALLFTTPTTALTAATYITLRVELKAEKNTTGPLNSAQFFVNGVFAGEMDGGANGLLNAATLVAPWVYVKTSNTTTKTTNIDYVHVWCDRNALDTN